jgi:hypothetical protein
MAFRTRLIPSVPTRIMPPATLPGPQGTFLAAFLTLLALVPFGAVLGFVLAVKFGQDRILLTVLGALLGAIFAWWKRKS